MTPAETVPPPDLLQLLHPTCGGSCMISPAGLRVNEVRIGINGNDEELIDPTTAASFYLILPESPERAD